MSKNKYKVRYFFYDILRYLTFIHILILYRPLYIYEEAANRTKNLKGSSIIVSNHESWLDIPFMTSIFIKKRVHFATASEVYKIKFIRILLWMSGSYKIERDNLDLSYLKRITVDVKDGIPVVIFPQGKLTKKNETFKFKKGFAYIACLSKSPITPIYISRSRLFRRTKVVIGNIVDVSDYSNGHLNIEKLNTLVVDLEEKMTNLRRMTNEHI